MRDPGIEPGSVPWQGTILPLNQPRFTLDFGFKMEHQIPCRYSLKAVDEGDFETSTS